jgi:hypothetical protein
MIARVLAAFRLPRAAPGAARPAARHRRKLARAAVWSGVAAFLGLTVAMAVALDAVRPEWRDPEFGRKLNQLRKWQADAPRRPLVVAFGSSRTQMGLSPAAMGFPDEPGSPLVYNFGYQSAQPVGVWLQFARVLDSGVKPAAVLVQLAPAELLVCEPAERECAAWAPRFSRGDIRRLAPLTKDPTPFRRAWVKTRLNPWATYREAVQSDLLPEWQTERQRAWFVWEKTDEYGFVPHSMLTVPAAVRTRFEQDTRARHAGALTAFAPGTTQGPAFRDLVARCRAEGIAVAFFWAPASPAYRSWFTPASRAAVEAYGRKLAAQLGVRIFPAPEHLEDMDFADGYHLLPHGAPKYSRWLADNHLRPWLAESGIGGER